MLTGAVKQHFQDCISSFMGTVTLPYLSRLEKKLAEHFKFREFGQLHQGSFLEFLVKNMQVCVDIQCGALRSRTFGINKKKEHDYVEEMGFKKMYRKEVMY